MLQNLTGQGVVTVTTSNNKKIKKYKGIKLLQTPQPILKDSGIPAISINRFSENLVSLNSSSLNMELIDGKEYMIELDEYFRAPKSADDDISYITKTTFAKCDNGVLHILDDHIYYKLTYIDNTHLTILPYDNFYYYKVVIKSIKQVTYPASTESTRAYKNCNGYKYQDFKLEFTTTTPAFKYVNAVCYGNGLFLAVAILPEEDDCYHLYYSEDGINWTQSNMEIEENLMNAYIAYVNGIFFIWNSHYHYYSTDGKTWVNSGLIESDYSDYIAPIYAKSLWIMASENDLYYSSNGKSWTACTWNGTPSTTSLKRVRKIEYGNGILVALVNDDDLWYSTDGKIWTECTWNSSKPNVANIIYRNKIWICSTNLGLWYSTDGKIWTQSNITSGAVSSYLDRQEIIFAKDKWIIIEGDDGIYSSVDGKTWTHTVPTDYFRHILFRNNLFIGNFKGIGYSEDGINWTQGTITNASYYMDTDISKYINGVWFAWNTTTLYYSLDGKEWTMLSKKQDAYYPNENMCYGKNTLLIATQHKSSTVASLSLDKNSIIDTVYREVT